MFANLLHVCNLLSINPEIYFPYTSHKSVIHKNETIFEDGILILRQVQVQLASCSIYSSGLDRSVVAVTLCN